MITRQSGALRQLLPAVLALVGTTAVFAVTAAPVRAAEGPNFYTATLAAPMATPKKVIQGGLLWDCAGDACTAARDTSRPAVVCARLAQKVGPVTRFATPKGDLVAEDLARCNGASK